MQINRKTVVTINGKDVTQNISSGTIKVTELIADGEFQFGKLCIDMFECQVYDFRNDVTDLPIFVNVIENEVSGRLLTHDDDYYITDKNEYINVSKSYTSNNRLFTGIIDSCKKDFTDSYRDIVAYSFNRQDEDVTDWWNDFWSTYPTATIKQLRQSLISYMGLTEIDKVLLNDSLSVSIGESNNSNITFSYVINIIGEIQQCFPHINRDGYMEYITLGTTTHNINDKYEIGNSTWEDTPITNITGVAVYSTSDSFVQGYGDMSNAYIISGNILLLNMTEAQLNSFLTSYYNTVKTISYTPCDISIIVSDLNYRLGDKITYNGNTSYILENTLSGVQYVNQEIISGGDVVRSKRVSSLNNTLMESNRISKVEQTIDRFRVEIGNTYTTKEEFDNNSELVKAEIDLLQNQIDGNIESFTGSSIPTLNNSPANSWSTDAEKDKHIGDLYTVNSQGGDYAGFNYRFEKLDDGTYQWTLLKDTDITKALADATKALNDIGALESDLNVNYYTKTETNSAIEQTATNITSTVSQTYETKTDATAKLATANSNAQDYANTAENNANGYTDTKLLDYSTTEQTESKISQTSAQILSTVSGTYATQQSVVDLSNNLTNNYSTTAQMNSAIEQKANEITLSVSQTYATQTSVTEAKGATIVSDTLHYLATSAGSGVTTSTTGWSTTIQNVSSTNKYLWTYHTYKYGDGHTSDTVPVITGVYGDKGIQGDKGEKGDRGDTGVGISEVVDLYYSSTSETTAPNAPTSEVTNKTSVAGQWTQGVPALTGTYRYLYKCTQVKYTDGNIVWTQVVRDNAINNLSERLTQAELQITPEAIISTVSATYVTKEQFGNMQIGGKNLIRQSNTYDYDEYYFVANGIFNTGNNIKLSTGNTLTFRVGGY